MLGEAWDREGTIPNNLGDAYEQLGLFGKATDFTRLDARRS
ncbi:MULTISPECIES: hypothetical protein [Streptomyces]|nr:hypothetical protein [Streptomyces sp. NEAU-383]